MTREAVYDDNDQVHFVSAHPLELSTECFWEEVTDRVLNHDERWGQAMFNVLCVYEVEGIEVCRDSLWDPYYRIKGSHTAHTWFRGYAVVEDGKIVQVRDQY